MTEFNGSDAPNLGPCRHCGRTLYRESMPRDRFGERALRDVDDDTRECPWSQTRHALAST